MLVMVIGIPVDVYNVIDSPYKITKVVIGDDVRLLTTLLINVIVGPAQSWLVKVCELTSSVIAETLTTTIVLVNGTAFVVVL